MFFKLIIAMAASFVLTNLVSSQDIDFVYTNGFQSSNLTLDGAANITQNGLLTLTDNSTANEMGHAFYPNPITFKNSTNGTAFSFSTAFVFGMVPPQNTNGGQGMAFVVAPQRGLPGAFPAEHLGLFNTSNDGKDTNHVFAVELDTILNVMFNDTNANHVGIDINTLVSNVSESAGYYPDSNPSKSTNLTLASGRPIQVWIDYDGAAKQISVTLAPIDVGKPRVPLIYLSFDLSPIFNETMFVGFSSATGTIQTYHFVLGWSFKMNGIARSLNLSNLPQLPNPEPPPSEVPEPPPPPSEVPEPPPPHGLNWLKVVLGVVALLFLIVTVGAVYYIRRKRKFADVLEDWEIEYGPHRFKYKQLYKATKGFSEHHLIGSGGFGKVYKGTLPSSNTEIAVKKVASTESGQGIEEFVAEIVTLGRLRHRNLVSLHGYCRRQGEMLLVYDYMPNGSLEKFLYNNPKVTLNWTQRFRIVKGVASGLLYLHEDWEKVVIHRDIKAGNVLLDGELNARLGDFGLARLYDRGSNPQTTSLIGTLGYLAPELMRTGRVSKETDVFAFGAFLLEVATGRRPFPLEGTEDAFLLDWVLSCWDRGEILEARDPNFGDEFVGEEVMMVLKLGLMCSHSESKARPGMWKVMQYLEGEAPMPKVSAPRNLMSAVRQTVDDLALSYASSMANGDWTSSSVADHQFQLSGGR